MILRSSLTAFLLSTYFISVGVVSPFSRLIFSFIGIQWKQNELEVVEAPVAPDYAATADYGAPSADNWGAE